MAVLSSVLLQPEDPSGTDEAATSLSAHINSDRDISLKRASRTFFP
jgi:hypothetical protein